MALQEQNKRIKCVRIAGGQTDLDSNRALHVHKHTRRMLRQSGQWSLNMAQQESIFSQRTAADRPVCSVNCLRRLAVMRNEWCEESGKFVFRVTKTVIARIVLFAAYRFRTASLIILYEWPICKNLFNVSLHRVPRKTCWAFDGRGIRELEDNA